MSFRCYCANCEQKFEAPDSMLGQIIECPACKAQITLDKSAVNGQEGTVIGMQIVKCPLCGAPRIDMPEKKYGDAKCRACNTIIPLKPKPVTFKQLDSGEYPDLDGYEIVRILGEGGMGAVYEAKQLRLNDRKVAIKILTEDIANSSNLDAEIRALVKLSHPEIITIFDLVSFGANKAIVMEAVTGPHGDPLSFREIISKNDRIDPAAVLNACLKLSNALGFAHSCGVLHLDLKPENILIDHLGHLRIVDFGLAQFSEERSGKTTIISMRQRSVGNAVFGTPGYMPPERIPGGVKPDARQDVYSLGAILYEMLIGNLPEGRFELPSELDPEMPGVLDGLVEKSLNFHPDRRYSSMEEFSEALENALKVVKAGARKGHGSNLKIKKEPPPPLQTIAANNPDVGIIDREKKKKTEHASTGRDPAFTCFIVVIALMGVLVLAALAAALFFSVLDGDDPGKVEKEVEKPFAETDDGIIENKKVPLAKQSLPPTPQNTVDVLSSLRKMAEAGNPEAQRKLGEYYLSGKDGLTDFSKAVQWLEKAAAQNDSRACFLQADLIKKGLVRGMNKMEALKLYMKAANAGDPDAQNKLGEFYFYGDSIVPFRDCGEAFKWFKKAADKNSAAGIYNLGECYYYGLGVPGKDYAKAVDLYERSAKMGEKRAQFALGRCYQKGLGVSKDMNKARKYYSLSARKGFAPAEEAIKKFKLK